MSSQFSSLVKFISHLFFQVSRPDSGKCRERDGVVQITPHRTHACAHFSRCVSHFAQFIQCTSIGSRCLSDSVCLSEIMPLLGVLQFSAFPPVLSSSTTTPTPLTGIRLNPCATPLWCGPSGPLACPTPNTSYEPKFCINISSEHTPIILPSRKGSFNPESDVTVAASEDVDLPRHSGASSSRHSVASTVPTLLHQETGSGLRYFLQAHSLAPGNWQRTTKLLRKLKNLCRGKTEIDIKTLCKR